MRDQSLGGGSCAADGKLTEHKPFRAGAVVMRLLKGVVYELRTPVTGDALGNLSDGLPLFLIKF